MIRKQKTITFGEYDDDVYEFLDKEKNASALIRRLVRAYMYENNIDKIPKKQQENSLEASELVEKCEKQQVKDNNDIKDVENQEIQQETQTLNKSTNTNENIEIAKRLKL